MANLRRRSSKEKVQTTHRYDFHMLLCVTRGACTQLVDFQPAPCVPGSLLVLGPGRAHNFGPDEAWDGWIVLFRPKFVLPSTAVPGDLKLAIDLEGLAEHLILNEEELGVVKAAIQQLRDDTGLDAPLENVQALLRHQRLALLTRLAILQGRWQAKGAAPLSSVAPLQAVSPARGRTLLRVASGGRR